MIYFDTINDSIKKFIKGMLALFMINLLIFGGMLLVQSCQTDDISSEQNEQIEAITKFENLVNKTAPKIQDIVNKRQSLQKSKSVNKNQMNTQYEEEARKSLNELVIGTKELLSVYDIDDTDYINEFENNEDPRIALIGLAILASSQESQNKVGMLNKTSFNLLGISNGYAQNQTVNCFLEATGISAGIAVVGAFTGAALTKTQVLRLVKKLAKTVGKRVIGVIGLAIIVGEFAWCMNRDEEEIADNLAD